MFWVITCERRPAACRRARARWPAFGCVSRSTEYRSRRSAQYRRRVIGFSRRVALPDAPGPSVVWNAGFGADTRPGERADGAGWPRQLDQRRERWVSLSQGRRIRAGGQPRNPSSERADHASGAQIILCPYGPDGTMRSLDQTRIPAQLTRSGADARLSATLARRPPATRWHRR